jgi:hypothetical protein
MRNAVPILILTVACASGPNPHAVSVDVVEARAPNSRLPTVGAHIVLSVESLRVTITCRTESETFVDSETVFIATR